MANNVPVDTGSIGKKPTPARSGIGVETGPPAGKVTPGRGESLTADVITAKNKLGTAKE